MSRTSLPIQADDISAMARSLRAQLANCGHAPGHLEMLNMLARSVGHRNFQSFRSQLAARARVERLESAAAPVDYAQVERLARHFDAAGRLAHWPAKTSQQAVCLWALWAKLPANSVHTELEINRFLQANHGFGDHALLRRQLCDGGMLGRSADGREYRRLEQRPPAEALALIRHLGARAGAGRAV
jgi:hypothetical protein